MTKPASRAGGIGSWKTSTPRTSCSVGAMYCRIPSRSSGTRFAAPANSSNGTAVATTATQQHRVPGRHVPNVSSTAARQPPQIAERGQRQHRRLQEQPLARRQPEPLLDQPVGAERPRERQRDPRQPPVVDAQHRHGDRADPERHPLQPPQPLPQHEHAEQDHEQRGDEVPQRGLDHSVRVHGEDVDPQLTAMSTAATEMPTSRFVSLNSALRACQRDSTVSSTVTEISDHMIRCASTSMGPAGRSARKYSGNTPHMMLADNADRYPRRSGSTSLTVRGGRPTAPHRVIRVCSGYR